MKRQDVGNHRTVKDVLGDGRWVWQVLLLLEVANALDLATSLVGVGMLGLPEQASGARWMIAHLGVIGGLTTLKIAVGGAFAIIAWGAIGICQARWPWAQSAHAIQVAWFMGVVTLILAETVISNLVVIAVAVWGSGR